MITLAARWFAPSVLALALLLGCEDSPSHDARAQAVDPSNARDEDELDGDEELAEDEELGEDEALFSVNNRRNESLLGFFIRAEHGAGWSANLLKTVIGPGGSFDVTISCEDSYFLRFTFSDGSKTEPSTPTTFQCGHSYDLDLTPGMGSSGGASPGGGGSSASSAAKGTVTVLNQNTRLSITSIRALPEGASTSAWSANLLSAALRPGASAQFSAACNVGFYLLFGFSDGTSVQNDKALEFDCGVNNTLNVK